ncbi:hypothetical protein OKW76_07095 [Sphingomonas sp. S1-29]|uniref:hypothetical protein n=1 Tax=Sphingomonas sp. S1-29 TaxID=2991074 RepID=UPI0022400344|nr:hypothetical protein [Sphingomonas sp. S1-29]UZK70781.1 hypothetical protein OKW76_07095 [Sphingomonas sp. S1-29]
MRAIITALAALTLASCQQAEPAEFDPEETVVSAPDAEGNVAEDTVAACTKRGIAYFKEIGSYPTLSSAPNRGRAADDVAAERCNRTLTAF